MLKLECNAGSKIYYLELNCWVHKPKKRTAKSQILTHVNERKGKATIRVTLPSLEFGITDTVFEDLTRVPQILYL